MLLYTMLYIVLAYLILFAALTNSVCLNNASFFFLFKYFLCQGYDLSGEIALKNNHYYYYYYYMKQSLSVQKIRTTLTICRKWWLTDGIGADSFGIGSNHKISQCHYIGTRRYHNPSMKE